MITFHAKPSKGQIHPTHTLCFEKEGDALLCTFGVPHPGLESYCKATGNTITQKRMAVLKEELEERGLPVAEDRHTSYVRNIPAKVRGTLHYYADQARRYFKMENEDPALIMRSQYADWEAYMDAKARGKRKTKVPVTSVWVTTRLNNIKPIAKKVRIRSV